MRHRRQHEMAALDRLRDRLRSARRAAGADATCDADGRDGEAAPATAAPGDAAWRNADLWGTDDGFSRTAMKDLPWPAADARAAPAA